MNAPKPPSPRPMQSWLTRHLQTTLERAVVEPNTSPDGIKFRDDLEAELRYRKAVAA